MHYLRALGEPEQQETEFQRLMREDREAHPDIQKRRQMTKEQKWRGAVEKMAKDFLDKARFAGFDVSYKECYDRAMEVARRTMAKYNVG